MQLEDKIKSLKDEVAHLKNREGDLQVLQIQLTQVWVTIELSVESSVRNKVKHKRKQACIRREIDSL